MRGWCNSSLACNLVDSEKTTAAIQGLEAYSLMWLCLEVAGKGRAADEVIRSVGVRTRDEGLSGLSGIWEIKVLNPRAQPLSGALTSCFM